MTLIGAAFFLYACAAGQGPAEVAAPEVAGPEVSAGLLTEREWVVEDIAGGGIIDRSRVTLNFDAEGRVSGRSSCNRYTAGYQQQGYRLSFAPAAATKMACADSLMNQEQKFFRVLGAISSFRIDDTGALMLEGEEGTMKAYPETP
jgi:heat shock protein HslJ